MEVHTIRYGDAWWLQACAPTLDAWCQRYGHRLRIWRQEDINPAYPSPKFCEVDMLREFLAGDAEWLMYVDADVFVSDEAPKFPALSGRPGFWIRPERDTGKPSTFPRWCVERFGSAAAIARNWPYSNAGVWACDRKSASQMLAVIAEPYHEGVMEQNHWNWWVCLAASKGMSVHPLPAEWNRRNTDRGGDSFFVHLAGNKPRCRQSFIRQGILPPRFARSFPVQYDFEKYRFTLDGENAMDEYHIHLLHAAAMLPSSGDENIAVEIGSYRGASTSALIEAINKGALTHLHIIEVCPNRALNRVIESCRFPERVTLHTRPSWELSVPRADLVFIDGDHKWPAVADTLWALTRGARIICMHDSRSWPRLPKCWGAHMGARLLEDVPGRQVFEDAVDRPTMATFRGFFVSATAGVDLSPLLAIRCE